MAYTRVTVTSYNADPPSDDGSQTSNNQVEWQKHLDKIGGPLKTAIEEIDLNVSTAFGATIDQGKHTFNLPANALTARETNGPTAGTEELATNDLPVPFLEFDAATAQAAGVWVAMPISSDESAGLEFKFFWKDAATAGTGDVMWQVAARAFSNDDAMDAAMGTAQEVTDTFIAAGDLHVTAFTSAVTPAGTWTEGDLVYIQIARKAADAADTYTQAARLVGVQVRYTVNDTDDS